MASAATPKGPLNWLRAEPELPQARTNVGVVGPVAPRAGLVSRLPMSDAPTTPRSRMDVRMEYSFRRRPLLLHQLHCGQNGQDATPGAASPQRAFRRCVRGLTPRPDRLPNRAQPFRLRRPARAPPPATRPRSPP